ncbi:hypothetical protein D9M68_302670 [compost metagenome]
MRWQRLDTETEVEPQRLLRREHVGERFPPERMGSIDEAPSDKHGEGCGMALEHGQRMHEIVPVAVIKRKTGDRPASGGQRIRQLFERDEAIAVTLQCRQSCVEEFRRDLQMGVGIEGTRKPRPDMVQREDRPLAARTTHQPDAAQPSGDLQSAGDGGAANNCRDRALDVRPHVSPRHTGLES